MDVAERIKRYKAIEDVRKRPLIVYATSTRPNVPGQMAGDAVREFIDQMDAIDGKAIDILLHSTGGDPLAAWKLMSMLRERFDSISVLVPFVGFSAATLFALGADEIVMHPHASLGPIDPQITIRLPDGSQRGFSFEDVGAFLRFLADEVGITEQQPTSAVVEKLFTVVDPVHVGGAKRASELSTDVGERLLQMHMKGPEERARARSIAEGLNKSFFAHGDAVSRSRARTLQLKIAGDSPALEKLMWQAYLGLEGYMDQRHAFKPLEHIFANGGAPHLAPQPPLLLPANAPQQLANQLWNQIAQQAIQGMAQPGFEVDYTLINALIESPRLAVEFRTRGALSAVRLPGGEIKLSAVDKESGWRKIDLPGAPEAPVA